MTSKDISSKEVPEIVPKIGHQLLGLMEYCGYPDVRISRAGCDKPGEYAFFVIDKSSLSRVGLRHLQTSRVTTWLEGHLNRPIAIGNEDDGDENIKCAVALQPKPEPTPVVV